MIELRTTTLGEVVDIFDHKRVPLSSAQRASRQGTYPYYGAQGIIDYIDDFIFDGRFILIPEDGENLRSRKLPIAYFAEGQFWVNNHAHIVKAKPEVANDRFVQSALETLDISAFVTGAAQPKLSQANLRRIPILLPSLDDQAAIAEILDGLDDLIENNRRRIKLLDQMAHALYREWFVRFQYPGYEDVPLVDSELGQIPKGWLALKWGDLAHLDYGRALSGYKNAKGNYPVFGTNGPIGWHNTPLFPPGVIVGRKGAYRGIHFSGQPCWVIDTAFYLNIHDTKQIDPLFAYYQLRMVDLNSIDSGSAIPSTSRDAFYAIPAVVPPADLMKRFSDMACDIYDLMRTLKVSSGALRTTRDILLPPLISGKIDASRLSITDGNPVL